MYRSLVEEGQNVVGPAAGLALAEAKIGIAGPIPAPAAGRKMFEFVVMQQKRQPNLAEVVLAMRAALIVAPCRHAGNEQPDQEADDGDDHQQFN